MAIAAPRRSRPFHDDRVTAPRSLERVFERRTFIVRIYAHNLATLEDVWTREHVRLSGLASLPDEIARRVEDSTDDAPTVASAHPLERP